MKLVVALTLLSLASLVPPPAAARQECAQSVQTVVCAPAVFAGRVLDARGRPARGARVVSSAGGATTTAADGSFELTADVPLDAECVELSVVAAHGRAAASLRVLAQL